MKQNWLSFLRLGFLAGLVAAAINTVLFFVGGAAGAVPQNVIIPNAGQPLTVIPVIISSILPSVVAGLVLALLNRFTKKPLLVFNIIAGVFLVLSFFSPLSIPGAPTNMIVLLNVMHAVVAGAVVVAFNRFAK